MNNSEIKDGKLTVKGKQTEKDLLEKCPYRLGDGTWVSVGGSLVGKGSDPKVKIVVQKLRRNRAKSL